MATGSLALTATQSAFHTLLKEGPITTIHLKTFNIFFCDPDFRGIYRSVGLTTQKWHGVSSTRRNFVLKAGSDCEKKC